MGSGRLTHKPIAEIILRYKILQNGLMSYYSTASNYRYIYAKIDYILKCCCALTIANEMKLRNLKKILNQIWR